MIWKSIILLTLTITITTAKKSYDNFKVIELNLTSDDQIQTIFKLTSKYSADIWTGPSKVTTTHIMLSPTTFEAFVQALKNAGITYKIIIENVETLIRNEEASNMLDQFTTFESGSAKITNIFPTLFQVNNWIRDLNMNYQIITTGVYGHSLSNNDLKYIKISTGSNRKAIMMNSAIHAREWLTVGTLVYIVEKILEGYKNQDSTVLNILSRYDLYFIPVFNPDGYELTHTTGYRLWRKNIRRFSYFGSSCYGVDLNRNFDASFGGVGTSNNPCDDIYRGPYAFSELETRSFANFTNTIKDRLVLFMSLHSYSQLWFVPYGASSRRPSDDSEMRRVAKIGNRALYNVNGARFELGSPPDILYAASGGAYDWMKTKMGVKYAYTLELRPQRSRGGQGFIVPTSEIRLSGEEVYAGLFATINAMRV